MEGGMTRKGKVLANTAVKANSLSSRPYANMRHVYISMQDLIEMAAEVGCHAGRVGGEGGGGGLVMGSRHQL